MHNLNRTLIIIFIYTAHSFYDRDPIRVPYHTLIKRDKEAENDLQLKTNHNLKQLNLPVFWGVASLAFLDSGVLASALGLFFPDSA